MEEKHGYFKPMNTDCRGYTDQFECSCCRTYVYVSFVTKECDYNYCPNCGAIMDLNPEKEE